VGAAGELAIRSARTATPISTKPPPASLFRDLAISQECRVPSPNLWTTGTLPALDTALQTQTPIKVLALGPFSPGGWAAPGTGTFKGQLRAELQRSLPGLPLEVEARRLPGEIAADAAESITNAIMEVRPNLVVWSAGTHDALARADIEPFVTVVSETLAWLRSHGMDVIIVEPPFATAISTDEHYSALIKALRQAAHQYQVPVVLRYDAMRYLAGLQASSADQPFRLHEIARRCVPEYIGRAVAASLKARDTAPLLGASPSR
jgi:acyl-CoA thioesterase I